MPRADEFDRVLDGDDVVGARAVYVVDHRGQRGRFSGSGRAGDQHQALRYMAEPQHGIGYAELLGCQDVRRNDAQHGARTLAIGEDVDPEAGQPGDLVGEIGIVGTKVGFPVLLRHDRFKHLARLLRTQLGAVRNSHHVPMLANHRGLTSRQMQVARFDLDEVLQVCVDLGRSLDSHDFRLRLEAVLSGSCPAPAGKPAVVLCRTEMPAVAHSRGSIPRPGGREEPEGADPVLPRYSLPGSAAEKASRCNEYRFPASRLQAGRESLPVAPERPAAYDAEGSFEGAPTL